MGTIIEDLYKLERQGASGALLTRADLAALLMHPDLANVTIHCIANTHSTNRRSPTLSISKFSVTQSSRIGKPLIVRYRKVDELLSAVEEIEKQRRNNPSYYHIRESANYDIFIGRDYDKGRFLGGKIMELCEAIRYCSLNFRNLQRKHVIAAMSRFRYHDQGSPKYQSKSDFIANLKEQFSAHAKLFDVNRPNLIRDQILEFVDATCKQLGYILHRGSETNDGNSGDLAKETYEEERQNLASDVDRLAYHCVTGGLPMALTLDDSVRRTFCNTSSDYLEIGAKGRRSLLLMLFPVASVRDQIQRSSSKAWNAKQIIAMIKYKDEVQAVDTEIICSAIQEFVSTRYERLRLRTLLDLGELADTVMKRTPTRDSDEIRARFRDALEVALQGLLETTLANVVVYWDAEPGGRILSRRWPDRDTVSIPDRIMVRPAAAKRQLQPICVQAFLSGEIIYVENTLEETHFKRLHDRWLYLLPWQAAGEYRSILCIPVSTKGVPVGCLELASRLRDAFPAGDQDYIVEVKKALQRLAESMYDGNAFQWLLERYKTFQNFHDLKNELRNLIHIGEPVDIDVLRRIQRYVFEAPSIIPASRKNVRSVSIRRLQRAVSQSILAATESGGMFEDVWQQITWRVPVEMKLRVATADAVAFAIISFADNMVNSGIAPPSARIYRAHGGAVTADAPSRFRDRIFVETFGSHPLVGEAADGSRPGVGAGSEFIVASCLAKGHFRKSDLRLIGIAPLPPRDGASDTFGRFGLFLVGTIARLNGGIFEIDRRPEVEGGRLMRVILPTGSRE